MSESTKIEWCDSTFNPWIGCTKVGPGCDHCYAEKATPSRTLGVVWGPKAERHRTSPSNWAQPLRWEREHEAFMAEHGRRRRVFCASLADVFDNQVHPEWRLDLFRLIAATPHLDWLLVTKRIGNVMPMLDDVARRTSPDGRPRDWVPLDNIWLGITVVNQEEADRDIPKLLAVPACVRFLSMEPLLGPIDLERPMPGPDLEQGGGQKICQPWLIQSGIDWVIAGGESGPRARPMHPDWARSLRDQCAAAGVPYLFKQWGEWMPVSQMDHEFMDRLYKPNRLAALHEDRSALNECFGRRCIVDTVVHQADGKVLPPLSPMAFREGLGSMLTFKVGKKAAGRLLDGVEHNGFPEVVHG